MYLYLFWFPAPIFYFLYEGPQKAFQCFLFSISFGLFLLISALLLVVELSYGLINKLQWLSFGDFHPRFLSIIFSSIFLLFNGRQMMAFEGKGWPTSSLSYMGCLLSELWHYIFYPISQGMTSFIYLIDFALFYWLFFTLSYVSYGTFAISFQFVKSQTLSSSLAQVWSETRVPPLLAQRLRRKGHLWAVQGTTKADCFWWSRVRWTDRWGGSYGQIPDGTWVYQRTPFWLRIVLVRLLKTWPLASYPWRSGTRKRVLVVTNSFHALRAGVFMRRLKIPGRSIGSRTAFTISHPLGFEKPLAWFHFIGNGMLPSLAFLFLPWFFTQIMKLIEFFIKLKEAGAKRYFFDLVVPWTRKNWQLLTLVELAENFFISEVFPTPFLV